MRSAFLFKSTIIIHLTSNYQIIIKTPPNASPLFRYATQDRRRFLGAFGAFWASGWLDENGRHTFIYNLIVVMVSLGKLGLALLAMLVVVAVAQEGEDGAYLQMRRTACLVLSRYHSNTQKEVIESTVQSLPPTDQNRYINKLYAVAVLAC